MGHQGAFKAQTSVTQSLRGRALPESRVQTIRRPEEFVGRCFNHDLFQKPQPIKSPMELKIRKPRLPLLGSAVSMKKNK